MSLTVHSMIVRDYVHMLRNMLGWLDKAQAHADSKGFDSANYLDMRLAPDMLPFSRQVLIACQIAVLGVERFSGVGAPRREHEDASVQDLRQRISLVIDFLDTITVGQIDGSAVQELVVPQRGEACAGIRPFGLCALVARELLFPCDDDVRLIAACRRGVRQGGFLGPSLTRGNVPYGESGDPGQPDPRFLCGDIQGLRVAASNALRSKPGSAACAGVNWGVRDSTLRAAMWSAGLLQDSTAIKRPARKHNTVSWRASAEPSSTVSSCWSDKPAICSLRSCWSVQNQGRAA
jgi:hypothetical protein